MDEQRSLGVTEARYALSALCCALVVVGYIALDRLGGTGEGPIVETRPDQVETFDDPDDHFVDDAPPPVVLEVEPSPGSVSPETPDRIAIDPSQDPPPPQTPRGTLPYDLQRR